MSKGGSQTQGGSGNGAPRRANAFAVGSLYVQQRPQLEDRYPRLRETGFFSRLEAFMIVLDVEEDARYLSGFTWMIRTPDDMDPALTIYFTYGEGQVVLQAVVDA